MTASLATQLAARVPRARPRVTIELDLAECVLLCLRDGRYNNVAERLERVVDETRLSVLLREARAR